MQQNHKNHIAKSHQNLLKQKSKRKHPKISNKLPLQISNKHIPMAKLQKTKLTRSPPQHLITKNRKTDPVITQRNRRVLINGNKVNQLGKV
jgi:hypothetical protein